MLQEEENPVHQNTTPGNHTTIDESSLPCPPRALWHDLPPSLGSGIPARIRGARPIPPRSWVTDFLPLHPPSFHVGRGGLRQSTWTSSDREHVFLAPAEPLAVKFNLEFPPLAEALSHTPQVPPAAELSAWTLTDRSVPSVPPSPFATSIQPLFPSIGSRRAIGVVVAPAQASWTLNNTFFTPQRRIAPRPAAMRPLPVPESGARPMAPARVRPTQIAGIVDHHPWKLAENPKPRISLCDNVVQVPSQQLANPRPAVAPLPKSVFQNTFPTWKTAPNSFVRRIQLEFFTEEATLVAISAPLPPLAVK